MSKFILSGFADEAYENLDEQIQFFKKMNMEFIEMRGVDGKNVADLTIEEAKEVKKKLDAHGLKLSAIGSPIGKYNIGEDFTPHLEQFKHVLELSVILDAPYIRMFSFWIPAEENADDHKEEVVRRWKLFLQEAEKYEVILLHENEKGIYGDIARRCLELYEALDHPQFKLIFDPANFIQCGVEIYPHAYEMLKDHVAYFHIKDALYSTKEVVPPGHGDGQLHKVLSSLEDFEGFLSVEPHLGHFSGFADLEIEGDFEFKEESSADKFALAVNELRKILKSIGGESNE